MLFIVMMLKPMLEQYWKPVSQVFLLYGMRMRCPEGAYVEDVWTTAKIAIDMSGMMDGNIVYMESYYNEELSKWLNVDKSNMPPTYTLSNKVYMVKLKDGTYAAVRLTNYMNASGVKGFMTIDYIYPFEL